MARTLWRISNYATLDGNGGLLAAGRWHSKGRLVVYCAANPATALLEILVHMQIDSEDLPDHFQILKIECPDSASIDRVDPATLPANWGANPDAALALTQALGDRWLASGSSLLLEVPSVLVPETWNILVNSSRPEAAQLRIARVFQHPFDLRLLR